MSTFLYLSIGTVNTKVYPLVSSRAVRVAKVACRGRRTWALNDKGELLCSSLAQIKRMGHYPASADVASLQVDDITALGFLGVIKAKDALALKEQAAFDRDMRNELHSLQVAADDLKEAGIKVPPDFKLRIEKAARKYATKRRAKRRAAVAAPKQAAL